MSDDLRAAFAEVLRDVAYSCGRVWEAWQYGTMSQDDFSPAWEDEDLLDSLVAAVGLRVQTETNAATQSLIADAEEWLTDPRNVANGYTLVSGLKNALVAALAVIPVGPTK